MVKRSELTPQQYQNLVDEVMLRDGWRCRKCKRRNSLHGHHIIFRSQGGPDTTANLCTLCNECHDSVHAAKLLIRAISGDINEAPNANVGLKFITT